MTHTYCAFGKCSTCSMLHSLHECEISSKFSNLLHFTNKITHLRIHRTENAMRNYYNYVFSHTTREVITRFIITEMIIGIQIRQRHEWWCNIRILASIIHTVFIRKTWWICWTAASCHNVLDTCNYKGSRFSTIYIEWKLDRKSLPFDIL